MQISASMMVFRALLPVVGYKQEQQGTIRCVLKAMHHEGACDAARYKKRRTVLTETVLYRIRASSTLCSCPVPARRAACSSLREKTVGLL